MDVRSLFDALRIELGLEIVAGHDSMDRLVTGASVQKPGLALAGFTSMVKPGRLQVLGRTETDYLWSLEPAERARAAETLLACLPPAVVVARRADIPDQLLRASERFRVPILVTGLRSSLLIDALHRYLANRLERTRSLHGVLVDVFGVGILLLGKSGIGKSECALELVLRGHRLVADDVVDVLKTPPSTVIGQSNDLIRHHMEIRGLGIISIKDLFGVSAIRETKRIELVVQFEEWDSSVEYDRLGVSRETHDILGVAIPKVTIPVRPGRSLTMLVEVAARNQLLKAMGHHSALDFKTKIDAHLAAQSGHGSSVPPAPATASLVGKNNSE
jgi:HPr kinase/phosphorylase